jgi:hypothetical protein
VEGGGWHLQSKVGCPPGTAFNFLELPRAELFVIHVALLPPHLPHGKAQRGEALRGDRLSERGQPLPTYLLISLYLRGQPLLTPALTLQLLLLAPQTCSARSSHSGGSRRRLVPPAQGQLYDVAI